MSNHAVYRRARPSVLAIRVAALAALLVTFLAPLRARAQQDTAKHAMPGMPGMKMPMPTPAPQKTAKPAAKKRSAKAKAPTTRAPKVKSATRTKAAAAKTGVPTKVAVPTHPPAHVMEPMPAMRDTSHAHMPAMRDTSHAHMPAMHDSAHAPMPGMEHKAAQPGAHDTTGHAKPDMAAMPGMPMPAAGDTTMKGMAGMKMIDGPLGIPMERTGSGTSWLPDDSPMHAYHRMSGAWELMLHGVAFAMYDKQGSRRGDEQFSSVNWGMLMATRELGGGRLQLRGMLSAEPWTVGGRGYPLLLQTGETFQGEPLHDRQHPHDLFMEVAGLYERAISDRLGVSLYLAPVGEPAIGPVAYPHRPSAMNDPMAPLSHHWQDATHIAFGVVTAGIFTHSLRLEGSIFNGREPDENRTNFDYRGRSLDSYAGRLAWNPSSHWSLSGSYAYIKSPEPLAPDDAVHRISASIMNGRTFGQHGELATTFVYGANRHSEGSHLEPSYLLESNLEFGGAHSVFGRAEHVQKSAEDLALGTTTPTGEFDVTSLVAGYVYEFDRAGDVRTGIGGRASIDLVPSALEPYYGTRSPRGFAIYVRFRPQRASEGHDKRMGAPAGGAHTNHP